MRLVAGIVSQNKRRYCRDGFDLDLAFINAGPEFQGRLIAMAYPSQGLEGRILQMPLAVVQDS